jgi:hypothetical protein
MLISECQVEALASSKTKNVKASDKNMPKKLGILVFSSPALIVFLLGTTRQWPIGMAKLR